MKAIQLILLQFVLISSSFSAEKADFHFRDLDLTKIQKKKDDGKLDDWYFRPQSAHVTKEQWDNILEKQRVKKERERMFSKGKILTVDTRDEESCSKIQDRLRNTDSASEIENLESLCDIDNEKPYNSVVIVDGQYRKPISFKNIKPEYKKTLEQTRNMTVLGAGMVGLIYMLPESVSKWDKDDIGNIGSKYMENVKAGPVKDKDHWSINYIGHPYSGAIYYVVGRHAGLGKIQSFGYSVLMSTFFWEYGFEAVAETPSIQDLLLTPTIGSLIGELFIHWEGKIKANNGKLFGSKKTGAVALALMDPAGALLDNINEVFEGSVLKSARSYWLLQPPKAQYGSDHEFGNFFGIGIELKF